MVEVNMDAATGTARVTCAGECTIQSVGELHSRLLEVMGQCTRLELDVGDVERADLAFLQVLLAAHMSARHGNRQLTLARPSSKAFRMAVASAGMTQCLGNDDNSGLWIGVEE